MKGDKELVGTLRGFDVYVNMVLEDVTEYEITAEGRRVTKLDQILLNGNNIAIVNRVIRLSNIMPESWSLVVLLTQNEQTVAANNPFELSSSTLSSSSSSPSKTAPKSLGCQGINIPSRSTSASTSEIINSDTFMC
ncbi:uncharacterized protein A4U43_C02F20270 [Asparagus officinalis]|uniref:U6 snRNA-associated Sm-like protein LSm5 n=1 Tax=Asparagus officinalis TaxID=4686 RepID=A0A5P1FJU5_ASPOF|nr:uncharacterized protein A4U43_C02F20270 [Asparagus officinalis]